MESSTVLVAGAIGFLGNEICRQLGAKNLPVKAMVRTTIGPFKTKHLEFLLKNAKGRVQRYL
jgi:nucleoside-diphosphate-sugar epimerase